MTTFNIVVIKIKRQILKIGHQILLIHLTFSKIFDRLRLSKLGFRVSSEQQTNAMSINESGSQYSIMC